MDLSQVFKDYLFSQGSSPATVKNYIADVKRFIRWFENKFAVSFKPSLVTWEMIEKYKEELVVEIGQRSVDRHISSLRKFFHYLTSHSLLDNNPLANTEISPQDSIEHLAKLKEFKDYLYRNKASNLTIKNYIIDVKQFLGWIEATQKQISEYSTTRDVLETVSSNTLDEYKQKLVHQSDLSIPSINRKLSSLRVYFRFAEGVKLFPSQYISENIKSTHIPDIQAASLLAAETSSLENTQAEEIEFPVTTPSYSRFPPLRLLQKSVRAGNFAVDVILISPIAQAVSYCQYVFWARSGAKIFEPIASKALDSTYSHTLEARSLTRNHTRGILRAAPLQSIDRTIKSNWFIRYHSQPIVRKIHAGMFVAVISFIVLLTYNETLGKQSVLGTKTEMPSRTLSFKGTLADDYGKPITESKGMRFSLYSNPVASGEAQLWQEVVYVTPNDSGDFTVELGGTESIPEEVFLRGERLYIGVSVEREPELSPRQPVANVHLANQSQSLQGLVPITATTDTQNVVLALDSSGDLVIGGDKSHTFKATGGRFELSGKNLLLTTTRGSNGNITLVPHGTGLIDLQKPIQNTSEEIIGDGPIGSVLINDMLTISSSTSGQSTLTISQHGFGPLISASSGGQTRFAVDNIGSTTIGHNLTIQGTDIASQRSVFNLLNRNVAIINFAGESEAVTIGSHSGTTTIRNARTAISGDITIGGGIGQTFSGDNAGITFSGNGNHTITASSGSLRIGSNLTLLENISIVPEGTNGTNNIGSQDKPFDTLYVNNIVSPSLAVQSSQNQFLKNLGSLYAKDTTDDILIGGNSTASALIKLSGTTSPSFFTQNVGIGVTDAIYRLHVRQDREDDAVAFIENTSSSATAEVLRLKLSPQVLGSGNKFINFLDNNGQSIGSITGSESGTVVFNGQFNSTGADFAEYFLKENPSEQMVSGDVICFGQSDGVTRCDENNTTIVGVVTDRAGFVGASDKKDNPSYVLVGLHGQIDVRILASEHIQPGDSLTFSKTKGILKKTDEKAYIVGRALTSSQGQTKILAYVNPGIHDPSVLITNKGNLSVIPVVHSDDNTTSYVVMDTINNKLIGTIGGFSDVIAGTVKTGLLHASEILVDGSVSVGGTLVASLITAQNITANTAEISDRLITNVLETNTVSAQEKIVAPIIETDTIKVHILSPVSDDGITVALQKKRIAFVSQNTNQTVGSIDSDGNASFSGTLTAKDASISGRIDTHSITAASTTTKTLDVITDATISGTLQVKELIAEKVTFPDAVIDEIVSKLSSQMTAEIAALIAIGATDNDIQTLLSPFISENTLASSSGTPSPTTTPSETASDSAETEPIDTQSFQSASISALTSLNDTLIIDRFVVNQSLMAYGPSSLSDVSVLDLLSVGGNMTIQNGSINTLGKTLEIQSLKQGPISFMAGRVMIDTNGNAVFNEDVTVKGTLFTNTLSPEEGENIRVELSGDESLIVSNSTDSATLKVSGFGDIIASGSGKFSEVLINNLKVIRGASADTSFTQTVASGSAGVATISPYETERTITTPFVKEDSLIYLTPASETYGTTPFVARQTPEDSEQGTNGSFTIRIQSPRSQEIKINWWIIN